MKWAAIVAMALAVPAIVIASLTPSAVALPLGLLAVLLIIAAGVGFWIVDRRRRDHQRALEAELDSFQALMGDLPELAVAMDAEGRAHAVFGRPVVGLDPELLHQGLLFAVVEPDRPRVEDALAEAMEDGYAEVLFTPVDPDAARISLAIQRTGHGAGSVLIAIMREAPGGFGGPAAMMGGSRAELLQRLQVSEAGRLDSEAARQRAEADAAGRARFLANMSHELRTPLNAIMGFSDIMRTGMFGNLQPRYAEYAELIHESGGHLLDLINDVLDMSKIEAHRFELAREEFDVREAVNAALRLVRLQADEAGVKLRGLLPHEILLIDADRRAVKQIVLNLVSNALKFTPADGAITVSAERAAGELELVVSDTGVGIAQEDLQRLGRPFEQAGGSVDRAQGTGLGLSLVRAFAELHGGRMAIESRLGEGTAVTVRLPVLAVAKVESGVGMPAGEIAPEITQAAPQGQTQDLHKETNGQETNGHETNGRATNGQAQNGQLQNGQAGTIFAKTPAAWESRVVSAEDASASSETGGGLEVERYTPRVAPGGAPDGP